MWLQVVKRMLEGNVLVAGGGAVEVALSAHLENYALSVNTREQVAEKYVDNFFLMRTGV